MITKQEVIKAQEAWGKALVKIGSLKDNRELCEKEAEKLLRELYAFEKKEILFKPTKASAIPFRSSIEAAKSYMLGGNSNFPEDTGFALKPWIKVRFDNKNIILEERRAFAMGHYFFTDAQANEIKVEFTFGYWKNDRGELKIDIQHSSLPFQAPV